MLYLQFEFGKRHIFRTHGIQGRCYASTWRTSTSPQDYVYKDEDRRSSSLIGTNLRLDLYQDGGGQETEAAAVDCYKFNGDISEWDTSSVESMSFTFLIV